MVILKSKGDPKLSFFLWIGLPLEISLILIMRGEQDRTSRDHVKSLALKNIRIATLRKGYIFTITFSNQKGRSIPSFSQLIEIGWMNWSGFKKGLRTKNE